LYGIYSGCWSGLQEFNVLFYRCKGVEVKPFDASETGVERDFNTPDMYCMITYTNGAVRNLKSHPMMFHTTWLH
jgi:hypothetical protein